MQNRAPTQPVVPAFTPVPRRSRHDGWTAERQRAFIDALADTGSVTHAAKRTNMSKDGAYTLRRQPGAESFRAAWAAALNHGVQRLRDIAIDRAIDGVPVPIMHGGQQVGERRVYNDRLLTWILRHHQPGADGRGDGLTPRENREAERLRRAKEEEEATDHTAEFIQRIGEMAARMAPHDPALDLSDASPAEKLMHILHRTWPERAEEAGRGYLDELGPDGTERENKQ